MKIESNFIVLEREKQQNKPISKVNENGKRIIGLNVPTSFCKLLNKCFDLKHEDWECKNEFFRYSISFLFQFDGFTATIFFEIFNVQERIYLNVEVKCKTKSICIKSLEHIYKKIYDKSNHIEDKYIIINAYDAISEYYCNLIFSKFAHFERLFRRLMFNIYVLNYGTEYYEKTINKEIIDKAKSNIRVKKNKEEHYLKEFFYSLDYNDLQTILFKPNWTSIDEVEKEKFLSNHDDLSTLTDMELRKFIENTKPKSDWDRLFKSKVQLTTIEKDIDYIRKQRNKVAHSKSFTYVEYNDSSKILNKLLKAVNEVIKLTEDKDFLEKNLEGFQSNIHNLSEALELFSSKLVETMAPMIQLQTHISDMLKPFAEKISILQQAMNPYYEPIGKWALNMVEIDNAASSDENKASEDLEDKK